MLRALTLAVAVALGVAAPAAAQDAYPHRQVQLITRTAAGGALDVVARFIAQGLQESTGQPFVVINRTGSGGNIGGAEIARASPDGYTIGMATVSTHGINPTLYARIPFDAMRDFTPISLVADLNILLIVNPAVPARDVRGLVAYAKANPGKLSFGSAGPGTAQHMASEMLKVSAGIDMVHVPYQGAARAVPDLLNGQIQLMSINPPDIINLVAEGKLRALAVAARTREATMPDVPTYAEQGHPDMLATTWFGVAGPAGLPRAIVDKLSAGIHAALKRPETARRMRQLGINTTLSTPEEFGAFVRSEIARWAPIVKASKARIE